MELTGKIILLYAAGYDMTDEQTGVRTRGTTISYIMNSDLKVIDNADGSKGMRPAKSSSDWMLMTKINRAPAYYNATFSMTVDSKGKPVLKILDVEYLQDVEVSTVS